MARPILSPTADERTVVDEFTQDFHRLQQQKARQTGGVESRVLLNLAIDGGEQYADLKDKQLFLENLGSDEEKNKLHLVFNLTHRRRAKLVGRLCAINGTYKAVPDKRDPKAFADAEIVDRLIVALDHKLDQPSRDREIHDWLTLGGTAFEYVPWVRNATIEPMPQFDPQSGELLYRDLPASEGQPAPGVILPQSVVEQQIQQGRPPESFEIYEEAREVGEVGSEVLGPLNVFLDQSVRSIADLAPDQAVYIAKIRTQGWIRENYGDEVVDGNRDQQIPALDPDQNIQIITTQIVQQGPSVAAMSLRDMIPMIQGSVSPDDPPMNLVLERFQPPSSDHPRGRFTCFVPGKKILFDGDNPYSEIPLVDWHFEAVTIDFWTRDYVTDLVAPNRFLNKRLSQLGEQANGAVYDKILLGPNLTEKDIPADWPGCVKDGMNEQGVPLVGRLPGPQLPGWFMDSIEITRHLLDDLAGGADLMQHAQFPGQLRGPMAVPMLQELLDTEWGPLYQHIGERMARVKQMRINRVKQFYPATRTLHYVDRSQRDEVLEFHTETILRAGTEYTVRVERGSLVPEFRALREARVRERLQSPLSILYIDQRTGQLDKSKIAADLNFGDLGRDSREAQYRKLSVELIGRLWRGETVPPVLPFWNHGVMMDELEAAMATTEFLSASQPVQQQFFDRWNQHNAFLLQQAQQQAAGMQNQAVQNAVAQATQQAAAQAAAEATHAALQQFQAQAQAAQTMPDQLAQAFARTGQPMPGRPQ